MAAAAGVRRSSARCSWPAMRTLICWIGRSAWTIDALPAAVARDVGADVATFPD